jgi:hypothetical protein
LDLPRDGRFPLQKPVKFYGVEDINRSIDDSDHHKTIKPIVRIRSADNT